MSLTPGTRLGAYEITAQIGEGGMGQVFRATDTKLKRQVAIKILPPSLAADHDRLARFQREAEVLASLNHPNIAAIYGLEEGGGVSALVMELVEGDDLSQRIARGAIPIDEALPIAKQIAEALEAAHEQGIIHRDLKPANIKVREDGAVKVLDFGLAKALDPAPTSDLSQSPTITTPAMTQAGLILGTAAYMSPEQAKGRLADKRSDVWAFGCVLYEMLTGRRAFDGEDVSDTLAAVLRAEPDWTGLMLADRPAIKTLIARCLQKDRRRRIAEMSTVLFVLDEPGAFPSASAPITAATPKAAFWKRALPFTITAALAGAVVGAAVWLAEPSGPHAVVGRFVIALGEGEQFTGSTRRYLAILPDGTTVAYLVNNRVTLPERADVNNRLYVRSLSDFDSRVVAEVREGLNSPEFSPDSRTLAFYSNSDQTIKRVAVTGGTAVTICATQGAPSGMSWGASGIIFGLINQGIFRCPPEGGTAEQLVTIEAGEQVYAPQWLPGGRAILFTVSRVRDGNVRWDKAEIVTQDAKSGARKTLAAGFDARYLPTGHLLYMQGGVAFAVPFDSARQVVTGKAVPVVEGVRRSAGAGGAGVGPAAQLVTSETGTLIYVPGPPNVRAWELVVALADRTGKVTRLMLPPSSYDQVRASPDGKRLAIGTDDGKEAIVWIYDLASTSALRRLTFGGQNRYPIWSPDSTRVAFQSDREGDQAIFSQREDGTGSVERLTKANKGDSHVPESWSYDGRLLSYSVVGNSVFSLWTLSVADNKSTPFGDVRSSEPPASVFSPDGRWIAYHAAQYGGAGIRSADNGVFVQPVPANGTRYQLPRRGLDFHPVWGPKGSELIYVPTAVSGQLAAVSVNTRAGVIFGSPVNLPARVTANRTSGQFRAFDILPDGRFVGLAPASDLEVDATSNQIRIVLNWSEELKRLVPTK